MTTKDLNLIPTFGGAETEDPREYRDKISTLFELAVPPKVDNETPVQTQTRVQAEKRFVFAIREKLTSDALAWYRGTHGSETLPSYEAFKERL